MITKSQKRERRKKHIRKNIYGTKEVPRVFVFKSNKYLYVGVVNDDDQKVITSLKAGDNGESAKKLGNDFGAKLKKLKITKAVFDRSGYKFHGGIKILVENLRESGIKL